MRDVKREAKSGIVEDLQINKDNWWAYHETKIDAHLAWDPSKNARTRQAPQRSGGRGGRGGQRPSPWKSMPKFVHKDARGVALRNKIFGEGAERMAGRCRLTPH